MKSFFAATLFLIGFLFTSFSANADGVCWKASYGRGVGEVPATCKLKQTKSGLLCYPDCKPGFKNIAGVCWQECPDGYRNDGAFCRKAEYGRGAGYAVWDEAKCKVDHRQGCEKSGAMWYPKCKAGFSAAGCCICKPNVTCPRGWKEVAGSCQKQTYVVAPITPTCGAKSYDAGLCYKRCDKGFNGIGPVCWGQCPADMPVDCGAMCGESSGACAEAILGQIAAVGEVIGKVAGIVASAGSSAGAEVAAQSAIEALKTTVKDTVKKIGKDAIKAASKNLASQLASKGMSADNAKDLLEMVTNPDNFDYKSFLKSFDVLGIAKVVDSFNIDICPTP